MRVFIVSDHPLFAQGMEEWLRQQSGLDVVGRESDLGEAAQAIDHLQPDVILLDVGDRAQDPTAALMRFFRNGLDTRVIGVNLADGCISIYCEGRRLMQGLADLLRIIQEAGNAACHERRAEERDGEERQYE